MATRIISAVAAALGLIGLGAYAGVPGLVGGCVLASIVGTYEYARMVFPRYGLPRACGPLFWITSLGALAAATHFALDVALSFAVANIVFYVGTLWLARGRVSNADLLPALGLGSFGLLYCALFPSYAVRLIVAPGGVAWFGFLLLVVFAGDTFAFFGGRAFGARKFMPEVSPNKTWEGSISGLFGSGLVGTLFLTSLRPGTPWAPTLLFSVLCGFGAQTGDLLISLAKRVAGVKDTGRIMPGHGGLLDRLDGVLIACPLVYAFSLWVD